MAGPSAKSSRRRCASAEDDYAAARAVAFGDVVTGILQKLGTRHHAWLDDLVAAWPHITGEAVARHTRPGRFEGATLDVLVDNSVWMNELMRYGQRKLLANLRQQFPQINAIRFRPDPDRPGNG